MSTMLTILRPIGVIDALSTPRTVMLEKVSGAVMVESMRKWGTAHGIHLTVGGGTSWTLASGESGGGSSGSGPSLTMVSTGGGTYLITVDSTGHAQSGTLNCKPMRWTCEHILGGQHNPLSQCLPR
jgi:hypothetical protein